MSSRKELIPLFSTLIFVAAAREYLSIVWLWLPVGFYTHRTYRTVTNKERVLQHQHPLGHKQETTDPGAWSFCEGGLLANHHGWGLGDRLLIKHTSRSWLKFFPESLEDRCFLCSLPPLDSNSSVSWKGASHTVGTMVFWVFFSHLPPELCSCHPGTPLGSGSQGGLHSWVPWDCGNQRDGSGLAATQAQCANSRLRHTPTVFQWRKFLGLSCSFGLKGRFQVRQTSSRLWICSQGTQVVNGILAHSLCLVLPY